MASPPGSSLPHARFLLVTGKGGVGKTTVCAVLARAYEAEGKRVLVAMCNSKDRLSGMFGSAPIGTEVTTVSKHIDAVNMTPDAAIEEYGMLTLKSRALYKVLFDNRYVRSFLRAVPGLQDWSMLGKAWGTPPRPTPAAPRSTTWSSSTPPPRGTASTCCACRR